MLQLVIIHEKKEKDYTVYKENSIFIKENNFTVKEIYKNAQATKFSKIIFKKDAKLQRLINVKYLGIKTFICPMCTQK